MYRKLKSLCKKNINETVVLSSILEPLRLDWIRFLFSGMNVGRDYESTI